MPVRWQQRATGRVQINTSIGETLCCWTLLQPRTYDLRVKHPTQNTGDGDHCCHWANAVTVYVLIPLKSKSQSRPSMAHQVNEHLRTKESPRQCGAPTDPFHKQSQPGFNQPFVQFRQVPPQPKMALTGPLGSTSCLPWGTASSSALVPHSSFFSAALHRASLGWDIETRNKKEDEEDEEDEEMNFVRWIIQSHSIQV